MAFISSQCIRPFCSNSDATRRRHRRTSPSSSADPSSPKVGCMGQVRRCRSTSSTLAPPQHPKHRGRGGLYFLMASAAFLFVSPARSGGGRAKAKKTPRAGVRGSRVAAVEEMEMPFPAVAVAVAELDPPLPVAAAGRKGRAGVSLWKRRCRSGKLDELCFCMPEKLPAVIAGLVV